MRRTLLALVLVIFWCGMALAQTRTFKGSVADAKTKEPLISAAVVIKGTTTGVVTDAQGRFSIDVDVSQPRTLEVKYLGFEVSAVEVNKDSPGEVTLEMKTTTVVGQEVVVSGSRISERLLESNVSIQKMNTRDIQEVSSGDFYQGLSTLQGVDITTSSLGFQALNMRGFNSTAPFRVVQFVDGMDNQAPGLNFPVGNLVGANDLDLDNVEVITGASSALYGPNAFQGVISMATKNPYDHQGLAVQVKGGTRDYLDFQGRVAKAFGKNERFAVKATVAYRSVKDWVANDSVANRYGDIETDVNLSSILEKLQYDTTKTPEQRDDFIALNNWLGLVSPNAYPGTINIKAPGYMENQLAETDAKSLKWSAGLYYKFGKEKDTQLSFEARGGLGTAVYQGSNRYSINNILFQQYKLEARGKKWNVKAYTTLEDAGDSYDIVFTGINISKAGISRYVSEYIGAYFDTLQVMTNDYDDDASSAEVATAHAYAAQVANANAWYQPGTAQYDSLRKTIVTNADLQSGSLFTDKSNLQHVEGQYNFDWPWLDVLVGANVRRYDPQSYGSIFADTLINPGDTLENGAANLEAEFVDLSQWEYGGFLQLSRKLWKDRLKLQGSIRLDKNQNFDLQYSPRLSAMLNIKDHIIRVSGQSAFRMPTLQNQYILLDVGPLVIAGNLNGWDNLYTLESVSNFNNYLDSLQENGLWNDDAYDTATAKLRTYKADPIRPEQVKTIEVGYRGTLFKRLYIDAAFSHNWYTDFIGEIRVVRPLGDAVAGEESGVDQLLSNTPSNKTYQIYQIPVNAQQEVRSLGATLGLAYFISRKFTATVNYTYAKLITTDLVDPIIPGFNTPEHKVNIGFKGRRIWKGLGFSANWQYVNSFMWESTFGDGQVPSYHLLDMQLSYEIPKWFITLRAGASNLYNQQRVEAYGSPTIGAMVYGSLTYDIGWADLFGKKNNPATN